MENMLLLVVGTKAETESDSDEKEEVNEKTNEGTNEETTKQTIDVQKTNGYGEENADRRS